MGKKDSAQGDSTIWRLKNEEEPEKKTKKKNTLREKEKEEGYIFDAQ